MGWKMVDGGGEVAMRIDERGEFCVIVLYIYYYYIVIGYIINYLILTY